MQKAESGDKKSQFDLGWRYRTGDGVAQSDNEAAVWYKRAAEQGYAQAQNNLGKFYMEGLGGCGPDENEAYRLYKAAADQGNISGISNLADCYAVGTGITQDYSEAFKLSMKAAERNHDISQAKVGLYYLKGYGVPQDIEEGLHWLKKAAAQGFEPAVGMLNLFNDPEVQQDILNGIQVLKELGIM